MTKLDKRISLKLICNVIALTVQKNRHVDKCIVKNCICYFSIVSHEFP